MTEPYELEIEPEVQAWLEQLSPKHYRKVEGYADIVQQRGAQTPMPYARPLEDHVYEIRPTLDGVDTRITFWITPDRRVVFLTVFRKTRDHEAAHIARAIQARKACEAGHNDDHGPAHEMFSRDDVKGDSE